MFDFLIKKGFSIVWEKLFGVKPEINSDLNKVIDNVIPNLEEQLGKHIHKSWWDSLIDGINRLPRPIMTFGVIFLIALPMFNPIMFDTLMQSLNLIPEYLWGIFGIIVTFWFGSKTYEKKFIYTKNKELINHIIDIKNRTSDFKDETKPLSQEQIDLWNARNNPNFKK